MKAHFTETGSQFFYHRYLIDSKKLNGEKKQKLQNEEQLSFPVMDFGNTKTCLHKCRLVQVGQENIQQWPLYLLKRVSYIVERKGRAYQVFDQNIKKLSQIRTQYLCYQIMNKSHRVVRMVQLINQNPRKQQDQQFYYKFLTRKKQSGTQNACFILELCNDGNLDERINDFRNPLSEDQIIVYCCQVLQGLVQLKKKGILHRDLRPCNIFLHNDEVKFGDFDSAFIYKESQCSDIKSGIDINTTPQQIVELASLSDEQLQTIGNLKLYDLQSKCDIYFFGMIVFKMIFKRDYQKKFQGTDIDYLIRQKAKQGFICPKLLDVMKRCLYTNVEKRIDLVTLHEGVRLIERERYFANAQKQRTYLSEDPLNLFSYRTLESTQPEIMTQIQNSVSNTFTLSFVSVEYNFEADFEKASLNRSTKLYADQVHRVHSKFYKNYQNAHLWTINHRKRKQSDRFIQIMQDFVIQMSTRAYFYDYLYKVMLKINTRTIAKKQQKSIVTQNKDMMEKELIIVLKFLFQILGRTPFKLDKYYNERYLPYETRKLFSDKIKINNKYNFFNGRSRTFNYEQFDTYRMIKQFYSIDYEQSQGDKFQTIYENVIFVTENVDKRVKQLLSESIVDLFRPYDGSKKAKYTHMKEILFIMIVLQRQKLEGMKKSNVVMMKQLLQPLFNGTSALDNEEAQMFFDNYKEIHQKQVEESKRKQNIQISFNLLAVSKKHLDCLFSFMASFSHIGMSNIGQANQKQELAKQDEIVQEDHEKQDNYPNFTEHYNYENHENTNKEIDSPQKQRIQVKVYEQNEFSEFSQNLQISNNPIMT